MAVFRRLAAITASGLAALLASAHQADAFAPGAATSGPAGDLSTLSRALLAGPPDPLGPFHLSLATTPEQLSRLTVVEDLGRLRAGPDTYSHFALPLREADDPPGLPAPQGLTVLGGDFFFVRGRRLVEATLVVVGALGADRSVKALESQFGEPDFEVVLPGALDMVVGWRTPDGRVMAWFSDLDWFRISAFRDDPQDLLAGSQMVLFDGLVQYSRQLAAGTPANQLANDLMKVVTWAATARKTLHPAP